MKKHTMVLLVAILVLLFGGLFYQNKNITNTKKEVKDQEIINRPVGKFYAYMDIYKQDEEGFDLTGVRFQLNSYHDSFSTDSYYEYGTYEFREDLVGEEYYEDAYDVLSNEQKNFVNSLKTVDDFSDRMDGGMYYCDYYNVFEEYAYATNLAASQGAIISPRSGFYNNYCYAYFPTYFTLEETRVPTGYAKEKELIPGYVVVGFQRKGFVVQEPILEATDPNTEQVPAVALSDDDEIEIIGVGVSTGNPYYMIRYGDVDRSTLTGTDIDAAYRIWARNYSESSCSVGYITEEPIDATGAIPIPSQAVSEEQTARVFSPYYMYPENCIVNYQGDVKLEANSYVNNVESLTTKINQTLEYKVVVKNIGDVDALDNKIRSTLPEGFIYVDGTATLGGTYNNGVIEWNIDRIDHGEDLELTFKAYAPKTVNAGQDYIGTTTVESFDLDKKVEANKTMVRLSLQNPSTVSPIALLGAILFMSAGAFLIVFRGYQQQKQQ